MNCFRILFFLVVLTLIQGCAINGVRINEKKIVSASTLQEKPTHSFYITGGNFEQKNVSVLPGLQQTIISEAIENKFILYVGDNINARLKDTTKIETQLDALLNVAVNTEARPLFLPGHREWQYNKNKGLEKIEDYVRDVLGDDEDILVPNNGCPLKSISINDDIEILAIDTEWYIQNWDYVPDMNDKCEIKSREKLFEEIEGEIKKNANKQVFVVMHHPMFTNDARNGRFALRDHLFPFRGNIPAPGVATLIAQIRSQGGVSKQDRFDIKYNKLMQELEERFNKNKQNILLVSGHSLNMQYIVDGNFKQMISGAGSRTLPAGISDNGLFSYGGNGFSVIDVYKDGSVWIRFLSVDTATNETRLLFTQPIFDPIDKPELSDTVTSFPETYSASVYDIDRVKKTDFFKSFWGKHYREVYGTKVTAPTAILDTLYGGLKVVRPGGGHQTRSLRLQNPEGKGYNMRALKKSAVQFLETTGFKGIDGNAYFSDTVPEDIILDFYTAAHPYGAFAIPELAEKAQVYYTKPRLFYVPKQNALGKYNDEYGDQLYMIVEKPSDSYTDAKNFGYPDDVESTDDLLEKLREDENSILDEEAYIRARIFDMLIGDWDRHSDQWSWAVSKNKEDRDVFVPIPRDRDQVFANFDGELLGTLRSVIKSVNQFGVYGPDIRDIAWFNAAGSKLDRALIKRSDRDVWITQAKFLQDAIDQATVDKAFMNLPSEVQDKTVDQIKQNLIARKANLVDIVDRYYTEFMKFQMVTGTDKDDLFEIIRTEDGKTRIVAYRNKHGKKSDLLFDRVYDNKETEEIWLYGLDDDDEFIVRGTCKSPITIRIIGGQNKDSYTVENGSKIFIYDSKAKKNHIIERGGATVKMTDIYEANVYDYTRTQSTDGNIGLQYDYIPDTGSMLTAHYLKDKNNFILNPYSTRTGIDLAYYFLTEGIDVTFQKGFAAVLGKTNLVIDGRYTNSNYTENFFGVGNDTEYDEDEVTLAFNRIGLSRRQLGVGLERDFGYGSTFRLKLDISSVNVTRNDATFLALTNIQTEARDYFLMPNFTYTYQNYNNRSIPSKGMLFRTKIGVIDDLGITNITSLIDSELQFYNSLSSNNRLVLRTAVNSQLRFGNTPKFYQNARIGGNNGLRGFRTERFNGDQSLVGGIDLSYSFKKIKTWFLPLDLVIYGGYDAGRVFLRDTSSSRWHTDFGGGARVFWTDSLFGNINTFKSDEGTRTTFGFGFKF